MPTIFLNSAAAVLTSPATGVVVTLAKVIAATDPAVVPEFLTKPLTVTAPSILAYTIPPFTNWTETSAVAAVLVAIANGPTVSLVAALFHLPVVIVQRL